MADNEQLVLSISADTRAMQRQLDKLVKQIGDVDNSAAQAFTKTPAKIDDVTKSIGKTRFETANLAAQFQDIAVQLQGGQSPFTVALQQGTQINQVIGQHGAAGAVALLGSAFKSLLTPTSLATIGIIALGGAAIQYGAKAIGAVDDLDDKLKAHGEAIKALKDAYGEAGKGVDTVVHEAVAILQVLAGFKTTDLQKELNSLSKSLSFSLQSSVEWQRNLAMQAGQTEEQFGKSFGAISSAVDTFSRSVASGKPDIQSLRVALANIISSDTDKGIKDLASSMLNMTSKASSAQLAIEGTSKALRGLSADALAAAEQGEAFAKAMKSLGSTITPDLTDRQKVMKAYNDALEKAGGTEERQAAARAKDDQLAILSANERKKAAESAEKAGESAAKRFQSQIDSVAKRNAQFNGVFEAIGKGVGEVARLETQYRLTEAAQQAFGKDASKHAAEIDKIADAAGRAADALARAKLSSDIKFERSQIGLSPEEQSANSRLRSVFGDDVNSSQAQFYKQQLLINDALRQYSDMGKDAFKGIASDLLAGKSAMESFSNALNKIANKLMDMALDSLWSKAFGGLGGGGGLGGAGLLSILPKFASGTDFAPGGMALVGERGPELVNLPRGSQVIPNHELPGMGGITIHAGSSIVIQGNADSQTLAIMKAELAKRDAQLPGRVVAAVNDARNRRQLA